MRLMELEGQRSHFSAVVLAGGRSTRMGTDKSFLRIGDELLIERQLRCLRESRAMHVLVSGRVGFDYSRLAAMVVQDEFQDAGPLAGVVAALKACTTDLLFVLAVDMPRISPAMIKKIVSQCTRGVGCMPRDNSRFQVLAAAYPVNVLPLAEDLIRVGRYSMQGFAEQAIDANFLRTLEVEPEEQNCFTNVNSPTDFAAVGEQILLS